MNSLKLLKIVLIIIAPFAFISAVNAEEPLQQNKIEEVELANLTLTAPVGTQIALLEYISDNGPDIFHPNSSVIPLIGLRVNGGGGKIIPPLRIALGRVKQTTPNLELSRFNFSFDAEGIKIKRGATFNLHRYKNEKLEDNKVFLDMTREDGQIVYSIKMSKQDDGKIRYFAIIVNAGTLGDHLNLSRDNLGRHYNEKDFYDPFIFGLGPNE